METDRKYRGGGRSGEGPAFPLRGGYSRTCSSSRRLAELAQSMAWSSAETLGSMAPEGFRINDCEKGAGV